MANPFKANGKSNTSAVMDNREIGKIPEILGEWHKITNAAFYRKAGEPQFVFTIEGVDNKYFYAPTQMKRMCDECETPEEACGYLAECEIFIQKKVGSLSGREYFAVDYR